jgi:hypothetical protein
MFRLVETCPLPETYDVHLGGPVATIRVTHHVCLATRRGVTVYCADTEGHSRLTDDERPDHLRNACCAVLSAIASEGPDNRLYQIVRPPQPAAGR